ncbi:hypothetical protein ACJX0J_021834, partial [Zea mays]
MLKIIVVLNNILVLQVYPIFFIHEINIARVNKNNKCMCLNMLVVGQKKIFMGHKEDRMRFENIDDNTDEPGANQYPIFFIHEINIARVNKNNKCMCLNMLVVGQKKIFMGHKEDRMRFENTDDNTDEPGANVSKRPRLTPLADASNPIMAQGSSLPVEVMMVDGLYGRKEQEGLLKCLQGIEQSHPLDCAVATSGIDNTIKILYLDVAAQILYSFGLIYFGI